MKTVQQVPSSLDKLLFINGSDLTSFAPGVYCAGRNNNPLITPFDENYVDILRDGKINAIALALICSFYDNFYTTMTRLTYLNKFLRAHSDKVALITTPSDISRVAEQGKLGMIMHFHNATMLDDDVDFLEIFHKLGLRILQLTYQNRNSLADGCGEANDGGLSSLGIKAIEEMNRLGIIVDIAHSSYKTAMEAIETSSDPVICSHACCFTLRNVKRNMKDDQIKALAKKGGVMGIMAKPGCIKPDGHIIGATIADYVDHVEHVIKLVGIDHVAVGVENGHTRNEDDQKVLDAQLEKRFPTKLLTLQPMYQHRFQGKNQSTGYSVEGMRDMRTLRKLITGELVRRGHSEKDIAKILGLNWLRVYEAVWK